jgi:hypothetical protein
MMMQIQIATMAIAKRDFTLFLESEYSCLTFSAILFGCVMASPFCDRSSVTLGTATACRLPARAG